MTCSIGKSLDSDPFAVRPSSATPWLFANLIMSWWSEHKASNRLWSLCETWCAEFGSLFLHCCSSRGQVTSVFSTNGKQPPDRTLWFKKIILLPSSFSGCSQETVRYDELFYRNERFYHNNSDAPFSGIAYDYWGNGQTWVEKPFINGKEHGWSTTWYDDGRKSSWGESFDGEQIGEWAYWNWDGDAYVRSSGDLFHACFCCWIVSS